ncbi:MAG: 50S ribosomal protein L29 [Candidatus Omnitrophica bacterium]|nr:50S ribosomal protein L29 [Candidatus Omnitrophota bacterium]
MAKTTVDFGAMNTEELKQKLAGMKKELLDLRMQAAAGKVDKTHRFRLLRRDIARVLTLLNEPAETQKDAASSGRKN